LNSATLLKRTRGVAAARRAIDRSGTGVLLTGRSEGFVCGRPDIDDTIRRLRAFAEAGADCLYAPRIDRRDHVAAIVAAVAPKPVNLLVNSPFTTVAETYAYSGGGAWFDEGTGCGYYVGVAHWQDQTETTPTPAYYCN